MRLLLRLPDNPTLTSQEKGINWKARSVYTKDEIIQQKTIYKNTISIAMMNKGLKAPMFEGPVYCSLIFVYKSTKKKLIGLPKDTKSDCDNIAKLLIDVLGDMNFFKVGDQQITDLQISKFWGTEPKVYVHIEPLPVPVDYDGIKGAEPLLDSLFLQQNS